MDHQQPTGTQPTQWLVDMRAGVATAAYARFLRTATIGPQQLLDAIHHTTFSDGNQLLLAVLQHPAHGQQALVQHGVAQFLLHDQEMSVPHRSVALLLPALREACWWASCAQRVAALPQVADADDRRNAEAHVHEVLQLLPPALRSTLPDAVRLLLLQADASDLRTWALLAGSDGGREALGETPSATPEPPARATAHHA